MFIEKIETNEQFKLQIDHLRKQYQDRWIIMWMRQSCLGMKNTTLNDTELQWHADPFEVKIGTFVEQMYQQCLLKQSYSCFYKNPCCSCDKDTCMDSKDCCIDAFFEMDPKPPAKYLPIFINLSEASKDVKCLPIVPNLPSGNYAPLVYQVNFCKLNSTTQVNETELKVNKIIKENCEISAKKTPTIEMILPVLGTDKMLYSNI